jgi:hypothetical protein
MCGSLGDAATNRNDHIHSLNAKGAKASARPCQVSAMTFRQSKNALLVFEFIIYALA